MKYVFKRIIIISMFLLISIFIFGNNSNIATSQENYGVSYYTNTAQIQSYRYYRNIDVNNNGILLLTDRYDDTLGEFLFAINSQHVYKVGFDKNGELVRYFRGIRIYTPSYFSQTDKRVKEINITVSGTTGTNKVRIYDYVNGMISKMEEFYKKIDTDRVEIKLIKDQSVDYVYNSQNKVVREEYKSYLDTRNTSSKYVTMTYYGSSLSKKEYFDQNNNLEYYYTYGNTIKHHKPNGEIVKEIANTNEGEITTEYYPPILINQGQSWEIIASEKYQEGVKVGYYYQNNIIYRFQRLFPKKNGFAKYDYTVARSSEGHNVVMENMFFTQYGSWKEASTLLQKVYAVLYHNKEPYVKELDTKWLSKEGNDLLYQLPFDLRQRISIKDETFIGAEYIIVARLKTFGDTTLAEIVDEDGEREWCDIIYGYIFFVASLTSGGDLSYNTLRIKSKGYHDFEFSFEINKGQRIVDLGELYMSKEL